MDGYDDYEIDNFYDGDDGTLHVNLTDDQEQLFEYINMNQFEKVKAMLNEGIDVNFFNKYGETPLMKAVGKNDILKLLLNHGANTEAVNISDRTALDDALQNYEGEEEGVYKDIYKESIYLIKRAQAKKERLKYLSFIKLMNSNEPVHKGGFSSSAIHQLFKNAPKDVIDTVVKKAVMMEGAKTSYKKSIKKGKKSVKKSIKKGKKSFKKGKKHATKSVKKKVSRQ